MVSTTLDAKLVTREEQIAIARDITRKVESREAIQSRMYLRETLQPKNYYVGAAAKENKPIFTKLIKIQDDLSFDPSKKDHFGKAPAANVYAVNHLAIPLTPETMAWAEKGNLPDAFIGLHKEKASTQIVGSRELTHYVSSYN